MSSRAEKVYNEVLERILSSSENQTKSVCLQVGSADEDVIMGALTCSYISEDKNKRTPGLAKNSNGRWQFDTTAKTNFDGNPFIPSLTSKRSRRMVTTLPFYFEQYAKGTGETMDSSELTSSHLCHHDACVNFSHVSYEGLDYNKSRNWCFGGRYCAHKPKCLRAGRSVKSLLSNTGGTLASECRIKASSSQATSSGASISGLVYVSSQSQATATPSPKKKPKQ